MMKFQMMLESCWFQMNSGNLTLQTISGNSIRFDGGFPKNKCSLHSKEGTVGTLCRSEHLRTRKCKWTRRSHATLDARTQSHYEFYRCICSCHSSSRRNSFRPSIAGHVLERRPGNNTPHHIEHTRTQPIGWKHSETKKSGWYDSIGGHCSLHPIHSLVYIWVKHHFRKRTHHTLSNPAVIRYNTNTHTPHSNTQHHI